MKRNNESNNKQSSSVDYLVSSLLEYIHEAHHLEILEFYEKSKAMHKEETKEAYNQGYRDGENDAYNIPLSIGDISEYNNAENYYNETFGGNK
jgi:flagellar biosynthesis/type III secretory pathway protein FliH